MSIYFLKHDLYPDTKQTDNIISAANQFLVSGLNDFPEKVSSLPANSKYIDWWNSMR